MKDRPKCHLCGSEEHGPVHVAEPPYRVLRCARCGLVFVHPQPESLNGAYEEEYYRPWLESQDASRRVLWVRRLRDMERLCPGRGRLLDVGCGIPVFLDLARQSGWQVTGTEVSGFACRYSQEQMGITVIHGPVEKAGLEENTFDVVTLWHVLEHVPEPLDILVHIRRLLRTGGLLVVATPNLNNHLTRGVYRLVRGRSLRLFSIHDREVHLFHFSADTLRRASEMAGFRFLSVVPDKGEVEPLKVVVDLPARALFRLTGLNFTNTIRLYARRPGAEGDNT